MTRNLKAVSMLLAIAFCMSFLAPLLVAPGAADAMLTGSALNIPTTTTGDGKSLGTIQLMDTTGAFGNTPPGTATKLECLLPSGVRYAAVPTEATKQLYVGCPASSGAYNNILTMANVFVDAGLTSDKALVLWVYGGALAANQACIINFMFAQPVGSGVNITKTGDVFMTFLSNNATVDKTPILNARVNGSGSTTNLALDCPNVGEGQDRVAGDIKILENNAGALEWGDPKEFYIDLILPAGVTFAQEPTINFASVGVDWKCNDSAQGTTNKGLDRWRFWIGGNQSTTASEIVFSDILLDIADDVKDGDILCKIDGSVDGLTANSVAIARKGQYKVTATADSEVPTIFAGRFAEEVSNMNFLEELPGSLVEDRTLTLELPSKMCWETFPDIDTINGGLELSDPRFVEHTNGRKISYTVTQSTIYDVEGAEFNLKGAEINVDVDCPAGPVEVTIGGTAGATGTITVANVVKPVVGSTAPMNDVIIGLQNQKLGDMTITETDAGALLANVVGWDFDEYYGEYYSWWSEELEGNLYIVLPVGVSWTKVPTVAVTEGDLVLDTQNIRRGTCDAAYDTLIIPVITSSTVKSVITISDVEVTLDRTVPEGAVTAAVRGPAVDMCSFIYPYWKYFEEEGAGGVMSDDGIAWFTADADNFQVAECITAAPVNVDTAFYGSFTVGSTIYYANGVAKSMDTAPFLEDGRVFIPNRYLAMVLGIAEENIVWDQNAQTVTLTTDDGKVAVLTVGSDVLTVDGTEIKMDVKAQNVNGRVFLPARWVTEGLFGAGTVGWDEITQSVLVSTVPNASQN